jgi:type I restriction enzyme, S subunit
MILHKLPRGWSWSSLDEVASANKYAIVDGPFGSSLKTSDYRPKGIPVLQGKNITNSQFEWKEIRYISEEKADELKRSQVRLGDLLMIKIGSIGYSAYLDELNGHDFAVIPANMAKISLDAKRINKRYAWHWLNNPISVRELKALSSKTAQPALSLTKIKTFPIPLPPLPEQKRVAAILDKADAIRRKRQQAIKLADDFLRATFLDMFGDPATNPKGWEQHRLGSICDVGSSARVFVDELVEAGIPFYRGTEIGQLGDGQFANPSLFITKEHYERLKVQSGVPCKGDLLLPSICPDGRIYLVENDEPFYFKDGRVLWIKIDGSRINSTFLRSHLKQLFFANYSKIASGTTFAELKIFALKDLIIDVPDINLQERFAAIVDSLEHQKTQFCRCKAELDTLFASLTQRAFRGEL